MQALNNFVISARDWNEIVTFLGGKPHVNAVAAAERAIKIALSFGHEKNVISGLYRKAD